MPDRTPIALWQHSIRMLLWMVVAGMVASIPLMLAAWTASIIYEDGFAEFPWLFIPLGLFAAIAPFVAAFYFGRDLRAGDHLRVHESAAVGIGGAGLGVLTSTIGDAYRLWSGAAEPDFERYVREATIRLMLMIVFGGVAALGAWWEGRTASARAGRPPDGDGSAA